MLSLSKYEGHALGSFVNRRRALVLHREAGFEPLQHRFLAGAGRETVADSV